MTDKKKPDNVVFDIETRKYDAARKPYATNIGASGKYHFNSLGSFPLNADRIWEKVV